MDEKPQKKINPDVARMKAAIARAETRRLYGEKERAEWGDRQIPSTFYMGRGANGTSLVKGKKGLQELETVGNIQPSMGAPGRGGVSFDPGTVSREDNRRSYSSIIPLKILVSWNIDGRTKFYIGGHVKTPILALDIPIPSILLSAVLTNTGKNKNDWVLQVRTGVNSNPEHYTRYGATPSKNWDLIGGEPLTPGGGGFWFSQAFPSGGPPEPPTIVNDYVNVGSWQQTGLDPNQGFEPFIWDGTGPFSDSATSTKLWSGWPSGSRFSGTNTYLEQTDEFEDHSGKPTLYFDPSQNSLQYTGYAASTTTTETRTISTQAYTFWAFEGAFNTLSGSYSYNAQKIFNSTSGIYPGVPGNTTESTTSSGSVSFSVPYPIAPGVTKAYNSSASYSLSGAPPGAGSESAQELAFNHYFAGNSLYTQTNYNVPWAGLAGLNGIDGIVSTGGFNYSSNRQVNDFGQVEPQYLTRKLIWRSPDGTEREIALEPSPGIEINNYKAAGEIFTFYTPNLEPLATSRNVIFQTNKVTFKVVTAIGSPTQPITFTKDQGKTFQTYPIPKPINALLERVWEWKYYD